MGITLIALFMFVFATIVHAQALKEIMHVSSADNSQQPAMFYAPDTRDTVPLIVAFHTWSADYKQSDHDAIAEWCMKNSWAYIRPDYRGPHKRPEATGSELLVKDIMSAVEYAKKTTKVDKEYRDRSPLTYLAKAREVTMHINAGIHDGHTGSVPISHSLLAFNEVADSKDKISQDDIRFFVEKVKVPEHLKQSISDTSDDQ